jgi:DNA helicase IV
MSDARNQKAYDVAPGIWVDKEGGAHFDVPALMEMFKIEDTPRSRQEVVEFCEEVLKAKMPGGRVVVRHDSHEHN